MSRFFPQGHIQPIHMREGQHLRLRRPRNLLASQQKMSLDRYANQSRMAEQKASIQPPKKDWRNKKKAA